MKKKIVCIGNSITNGFPFKRSQSFPSLIREATGFEVINKGENGETTAQVLARFQHDVIDHKPDIVTILTGTNDFIFSLDTMGGAFEKIKEMVSLARTQDISVLLLTPLLTVPEMAKAAWMTGSDIDYDKVNHQLIGLGSLIREYCADNQIHSSKENKLVNGTFQGQDIFSLDLQRLYRDYEEEIGTENAFHDGLHPTIEGQAFIADCVLKAFSF